MYQVQRNFYHVNVRNNRLLIETYCLVCHKFIAASKSESNLNLSEIAHRSTCRQNTEKPRLDQGGRRLA
jgi:hypothetical protein